MDRKLDKELQSPVFKSRHHHIFELCRQGREGSCDNTGDVKGLTYNMWELLLSAREWLARYLLLRSILVG
jgi:hypothetical protein